MHYLFTINLEESGSTQGQEESSPPHPPADEDPSQGLTGSNTLWSNGSTHLPLQSCQLLHSAFQTKEEASCCKRVLLPSLMRACDEAPSLVISEEEKKRWESQEKTGS